LPVEKPRLSVTAYLGQRDRKEAWRLYEEWRLRKELILKTKQTQLPAGWDAHLQPETFREPEGNEMPPVDVSIGPHGGYVVHTNLLPGMSGTRIGNGNGDGDDRKD
jgi:hypothetical protein